MPRGRPKSLHKLGDDVYQVETILNHRQSEGREEFLIKWQGFDDKDSTWEPSSNIYDKSLIDIYQKELRLKAANERQKRRSTEVQVKKVAETGQQEQEQEEEEEEEDEDADDEDDDEEDEEDDDEEEEKEEVQQEKEKEVEKEVDAGAAVEVQSDESVKKAAETSIVTEVPLSEDSDDEEKENKNQDDVTKSPVNVRPATISNINLNVVEIEKPPPEDQAETLAEKQVPSDDSMEEESEEGDESEPISEPEKDGDIIGATIRNQKLVYLMKWKNGEHQVLSSTEVKDKWPQLLIEFYERNIQWVDKDYTQIEENNTVSHKTL